MEVNQNFPEVITKVGAEKHFFLMCGRRRENPLDVTG